MKKYQVLLTVIFLGILVEQSQPVFTNNLINPETQVNQEESLDNLSKKLGYDPRDYQMEFKITGQNITIFDSSYWIKMHVQPSQGKVEVKHQTMVRDKFWVTLQKYDHLPSSTKFILDSQYCRAIFRQDECIFTGANSVELPNFISNHLLIKKGTWEITYTESGKELTYVFTIPGETIPKGFNSESLVRDVHRDMCEIFPDGILCLRRSSP